MKDGMYMEYEGIYIHPNGDSPKIAEYAIFNSPGFDVAEDKFKYRYAFRIARVDGLCFAFIVGPGWTKGCWDIRLDSIELFKENEITRAK